MCPDGQILSIYLDKELPSPFKEKLEAHLADCPACRQRLEAYGALQKTAAAEGVALAEQSAAACGRVWQKLSRRRVYRRPPVWGRTIPVPLPAAAAVFVVIFALALAALTRRPDVPPQMTLGLDVEAPQTQQIPVTDLKGVLSYLGGDDNANIVIIHLPESQSFQRIGEPALLKAADYRPDTRGEF